MLQLQLESFLAIFFFVPNILSHSFILSLDGVNGVRATSFGARLTLRGGLHQNTGIIKDSEILAKTVGPCGRIFGGDFMPPFQIDPHYELVMSESSGVPMAKSDGSIKMGVYVYNPDGAGPYKCDYSPDTTLNQFYPMNITVQVEGDNGVNDAAHDYVYPLTAAFFPNASCSGGQQRNSCIMRCRNPLGFGSCAAVKLSEGFGGPPPSGIVAKDQSQPQLNLSHENQGLERRRLRLT